MEEDKFDLTSVKALSREKRQYFAAEIRKDPELWDAVHGFGGLPETADHGMLIGTVTLDKKPLSAIRIVALKSEKEAREEFVAITNQYGFYKMNLEAGTYIVVCEYDNRKVDGKEVTIKNGETEIVNFNFEGEGSHEAEIEKLNILGIENETEESGSETITVNEETTGTETSTENTAETE